MLEFAAYATVVGTLGLVVSRPRLSKSYRLSPAAAAIVGGLLLALFGVVRLRHVVEAATNLWAPFVTIAAIMIMTHVAHRSGLLAWCAQELEARASSTQRLFLMVYMLGVLTSTVLNNDAAILLLTPIVLTLVKRRFPGRPELLPPFAFAVFMSAGVAALPVSNPMNMVVAEFSGISFTEYVGRMAPVAVAGWLVAFVVLRLLFARQLSTKLEPQPSSKVPPSTLHRRLLAVILVVLGIYPLLALLSAPIWPAATAGALVSLALARWHQGLPTRELAACVSWDTLAFLLAVLVISLGLRDVGFVERLAGAYHEADVFTVGAMSALGSAVLNNHPMSHLNMIALQSASAPRSAIFAALVGGDLGPRLLPMGSLAGLLWLEMLRRAEVKVGVGTFIRVGVLVAVPTMVVSLAILAAN